MLTAIVIALVIAGAHLFYTGFDFADHYSYLDYTDRVAYFDDKASLLLEPLSKGLLLFLKEVTGSTENGVGAAHYVIGLVFYLGMLAMFPRREANWRGMLLTFAIYGPQLAFVTLRATPAYMLTGLGTVMLLRRQRNGPWLVGSALLFHVSAVLAWPPLVALAVGQRTTWLDWLQRPRNIGIAAAVLLLLFATAGGIIVNAATAVFSAIPYLAKYLFFLRESDTGVDLSRFPLAHFIFLAALTGFTGLVLLVDDVRMRRARIYVTTSFAVYLFIFLILSPIAAFRQTPFWMLPALAIFPWQRVGWRGPPGLLFLAGTVVIFLFQFSRVMAVAL